MAVARPRPRPTCGCCSAPAAERGGSPGRLASPAPLPRDLPLPRPLALPVIFLLQLRLVLRTLFPKQTQILGPTYVYKPAAAFDDTASWATTCFQPPQKEAAARRNYYRTHTHTRGRPSYRACVRFTFRSANGPDTVLLVSRHSPIRWTSASSLPGSVSLSLSVKISS